MRQFQAEPEAQPGCTQLYSSQTEDDSEQRHCATSLGAVPRASIGMVSFGSLIITPTQKLIEYERG